MLRRLLLLPFPLLFALVALVPPAAPRHAIALVQSAIHYDVVFDDQGSVTLSSPATAGNCIVVGLSFLGDSGSALSVTGTGASFAAVSSSYQAATGGGSTTVEWWEAHSIAGGTTAIAVTLAGTSSDTVIYAAEVSACAGTGTINAVATKTETPSSDTTLEGGSVTTTTASTLIFSMIHSYRAASGIHSGNVFTNDKTEHTDYGVDVATYGPTSTGSYEAQWDVSEPTNYYSGSTIAVKEGSGAQPFPFGIINAFLRGGGRPMRFR